MADSIVLQARLIKNDPLEVYEWRIFNASTREVIWGKGVDGSTTTLSYDEANAIMTKVLNDPNRKLEPLRDWYTV